jgi:hypothetical protein
MSRKTKADLEAENQALKNENDILRDQVGWLGEELDAEINAKRVIESAYDADIQKLVKLSKGRVQREWEALGRKKYLQSRYAEYRKKHNITESRKRANDKLAREFGEKYRLKDRQLIKNCKD